MLVYRVLNKKLKQLCFYTLTKRIFWLSTWIKYTPWSNPETSIEESFPDLYPNGYDNSDFKKVCPECGGKGIFKDNRKGVMGIIQCSKCQGTGLKS